MKEIMHFNTFEEMYQFLMHKESATELKEYKPKEKKAEPKKPSKKKKEE